MDESEINKHVGQQLRSIRLLRGMNQTQLGKPLKITYQQIQKYEQGTDSISTAKLFNLANILGVEPWFFFDGLPRRAHTPVFATLEREHMTLLNHYNAAPPKARKTFIGFLRMASKGEKT